ncbi:hypothetical protein PGTUg99_008612 [Puccinia graminis f. sp. tritici]|uniref:Uncharacterized protein n=1 Tax=Puccinia graminis f. sp. tritici TaxID=56615 RepID=A0A5B0PPR4_PUCGR|nr:hypothetical protein PGTUg99_008612 [Puccinia graminis f. sp. tritici]
MSLVRLRINQFLDPAASGLIGILTNAMPSLLDYNALADKTTGPSGDLELDRSTVEIHRGNLKNARHDLELKDEPKGLQT